MNLLVVGGSYKTSPIELREKLAMIDPDDLSPREAQAALYALKKLAGEK